MGVAQAVRPRNAQDAIERGSTIRLPSDSGSDACRGRNRREVVQTRSFLLGTAPPTPRQLRTDLALRGLPPRGAHPETLAASRCPERSTSSADSDKTREIRASGAAEGGLSPPLLYRISAVVVAPHKSHAEEPAKYNRYEDDWRNHRPIRCPLQDLDQG